MGRCSGFRNLYCLSLHERNVHKITTDPYKKEKIYRTLTLGPTKNNDEQELQLLVPAENKECTGNYHRFLQETNDVRRKSP